MEGLSRRSSQSVFDLRSPANHSTPRVVDADTSLLLQRVDERLDKDEDARLGLFLLPVNNVQLNWS
jgi:hypothetical protein